MRFPTPKTAPRREVIIAAMSPTAPSPEQIARHLLDAYEEHIRFLGTPRNGPADAEQAYAVQRLIWRHMVGEERPQAWKVGASSKTAAPVAAPIFPGRCSESPGRFRRRGICSVGIEAEIALRFSRDLAPRAQPYRRDEILAAIGSVHVAIEVVDSRLHDADYAGPYWCLADNLLNGALILGDAIPQWRELDWQDRQVTITANGVVLDDRVASPPLHDLFHCLPWWIAHIGGVTAGDVVTTGAWTGMHPIHDAREVSVAFAGLGQCHAESGLRQT